MCNISSSSPQKNQKGLELGARKQDFNYLDHNDQVKP